MTALWAILLLICPEGRTATAVLECTADTNATAADGHAVELTLSKTAFLNFQFQTVSAWTQLSGTLLLHVASGTPPGKLEISLETTEWSEKQPPTKVAPAGWVVRPVVREPDGWIRVDLPGELLEPLARGSSTGLRLRGTGVIHARESIDHAPYLLLEGTPRVQ